MSINSAAMKLVDAINREAQKEVSQSTSEITRECRILRNKLRSMTAQRDKQKARCAELKGHIARYQAELVKLRGR